MLFVHSKHHWDNIQVGYHLNQVRFILNKKHLSWDPFTPSGKQTLTVTHEIPSGFTIVDKYNDDDWKGVLLKQAEFEEKASAFAMS